MCLLVRVIVGVVCYYVGKHLAYFDYESNYLVLEKTNHASCFYFLPRMRNILYVV